MTETTTKLTIKILKQHIARYGIPDILMRDNRRQFTSHEFRSLTGTGKFNTTLAALAMRNRMEKLRTQ